MMVHLRDHDHWAAVHALLLTDVVDSTRTAEALGDAAMADVWACHDRVARGLLADWQGREIDKSDGMLMLFESVDGALGFALAFHQALAGHGLPICVRAGLHVGPVKVHANAPGDVARGAKAWEVSGIAVPAAARIMSLALGGQTLLSAQARCAARVDESRVRSHGHWQLKGLAEPVELFEVVGAGGSFRAPIDLPKAYRVVRRGEVWMPARDIAHSVPAERDEFVGRQAALHDLARLLDDGATRLVSILGIGGTGKTRLATRFARAWLGEFPGGAWFCDLSHARGVDGIHHAAARGLGLQLGRTKPEAQIADAIAGRSRCLLVLDNFEQVARHAEATLGRWLDGAPQARFIVTTREVLGVPGEAVLALPPLPQGEAVELFGRRARAAHQGFAPDAQDRAAIDQLAQALDGLPLAIELAAARVRAMPPSVLLQRMHRRFDLLAARGGRTDRQATLRAMLDWSWDLLGDDERAVLAQLAVFRGSFDLQAVDAVLRLPGPAAAGSAADLVAALVDKSLVRQAEGYRFSLLESVRDYADLRLHEAGASIDPQALLARHRQHYAGLDEAAAVAQHCADLGNVMAACRSAVEADDAATATRCLVNAWVALRLIGPFSAAVTLAQQVARLAPLCDSDAGLVGWVLGSALDSLGQVAPAQHALRRGLARCDSAAPCEAQVRLRIGLGSQLTLEGEQTQARALLDDAYRRALALKLTALQAEALLALGRLLDHQAQVTEARQCYEQALDLARALGDRRLEGGLLGNLGGLHHDLGELDTARRHYEQAMQLADETGDRRWQGNACSNLGLLLQEQGHHAEAHQRLAQALALAQAAGHVRLAYTVACNLGILLMAEGRLADAEQQLRGAVAAAGQAADRRAEGQFLGYLAVTLARRGCIDEARGALDRGEQALRAMADGLSLAVLLCDRAEVEALAGAPGLAESARAGAQRIADDLACGPESELRRRLATLALPLADQTPASDAVPGLTAR